MAEGERFRAVEESTATRVQRAKQRDSRTEDQCQLALTSPRACLLTRWGGCDQELRLGLRLQHRERTGSMNTP